MMLKPCKNRLGNYLEQPAFAQSAAKLLRECIETLSTPPDPEKET